MERKMDEGEAESLSRVTGLLGRAKMNTADLKNEVQHLCVESRLSAGEFCLLQVDGAILREIEEHGLVIRGDSEDSAYACTKEKSFLLKEAETSNSILLSPDCRYSKDCSNETANSEIMVSNVLVSSVQHKMMELVEEKQPRMDKLRRMLEENPYSGPQNEPVQVGKPRYRLEDFLEHVAASECHIIHILSEMPVVQIEGYYRKLDFDYIIRLYTEVSQCIDENSWNWTSVDKRVVVDHLTTQFNEPSAVVEAFFRWFARANGENGAWTFDERSICRLCAEMLLKPTKKFNANDFFSIWAQTVPYGMAEYAVQEQLSGLAIVQLENGPPYVEYLPTESLSDDLEECLAALFRVKQKWLLEELKHYIRWNGGDSATELMKYCRVSMGPDGKRWYTSKYATGGL